LENNYCSNSTLKKEQIRSSETFQSTYSLPKYTHGVTTRKTTIDRNIELYLKVCDDAVLLR